MTSSDNDELLKNRYSQVNDHLITSNYSNAIRDNQSRAALGKDCVHGVFPTEKRFNMFDINYPRLNSALASTQLLGHYAIHGR